jgi:hypothetical protein
MSHLVRPGTRRTARGQGLAEFALVLPVFFLIFFGLIDLGSFAFTNNVMSEAAREGARVAAAQAGWIGNPTGDPSCNAAGGPVCPSALQFTTNVTNAVRAASSGLTSTVTVYVRCDAAGTTPPTGAWTTGSCSSNNAKNNLVSVRIEYTVRALTPIGQSIIGGRVQSGSATMVIN